jgi:hypothetical protein
MVSLGLASEPVATVLVVLHQNHSFMFSSLGLKTGSCGGLIIWASKSPWQFLGLGLKINLEEVCWFVPQNRWTDEDGVRTRVDIRCLDHDSFLVWASKSIWRRFVGLCLKTDGQIKTVWGHASTFGVLLRREAIWARVFQFYLKIGGGATAGGARGIIVEVTWKWSKRQLVRWRPEGGEQLMFTPLRSPPQSFN